MKAFTTATLLLLAFIPLELQAQSLTTKSPQVVRIQSVESHSITQSVLLQTRPITPRIGLVASSAGLMMMPERDYSQAVRQIPRYALVTAGLSVAGIAFAGAINSGRDSDGFESLGNAILGVFFGQVAGHAFMIARERRREGGFQYEGGRSAGLTAFSGARALGYTALTITTSWTAAQISASTLDRGTGIFGLVGWLGGISASYAIERRWLRHRVRRRG